MNKLFSVVSLLYVLDELEEIEDNPTSLPDCFVSKEERYEVVEKLENILAYEPDEPIDTLEYGQMSKATLCNAVKALLEIEFYTLQAELKRRGIIK